MTALDSTSNATTSSKNGSTSSRSPRNVRNNRSKLGLRGQKRALSSDISPAPEPRSSHRVRTSSTGDHEDRNKVNVLFLKIFRYLK